MSAPAATASAADTTSGSATTPAAAAISEIPVTVLSGFLGAGKTTLLLNLVKDMAGSGVQFAWLKNEYGNVEVDSRLAKESKLDVAEVLNGCVCCTAVGKLGPVLSELIARYRPQRILLETSGSSLPAPLAWELKRLAEQEHLPVTLDALICVIDAAQHSGTADRSVTARLQAQYTDLILINKWEGLPEEQVDTVLDDVCELNPATPKLRTQRGRVDPELLLGLDSALWASMQKHPLSAPPAAAANAHDDSDVRVLDLVLPAAASVAVPWSRWERLLAALPTDSVWRVKGVVLLPEPQAGDEQLEPAQFVGDAASGADSAAGAHASGCSCCSSVPPAESAAATTSAAPVPQESAAAGGAPASATSPAPVFAYLLNCAFGRTSLTPLRAERYTGPTRVSFMGDRDVATSRGTIAAHLQIEPSAVKLLAHR